jgi:3-deoxy-manno-octulosonate cytidylyltransferase (CMP-KDO synthetase)
LIINTIDMNYVGIIPARYESSRFPGKPLADIDGKPMVQHVYERARRGFSRVAVATDDERIAAAVRGFGGEVVMTSTSHRSGTDRCAEAAEKLAAASGEVFDVVVNIQGDEPFIDGEQLELLKGCFSAPAAPLDKLGVTTPDVQIATLVKRFGAGEDVFSPNTPKVAVSTDGYALYFSRAVIPYLRGVAQEEWPTAYPFYKHVGLYAYRTDTLREICRLEQSPLELAESLEQLRWLENGYRIKVAVTEGETWAVDTPEDLERVRRMAAAQRQ